MTYIAVSQKHQRKGVAQYLVANALAAIADEAKDGTCWRSRIDD